MYLSEKEFKDMCKKMNIDPKKYTQPNKKKKPSKSFKDDFDSLAESNFFHYFLQKQINSGFVTEYKLHTEYVIVDAIPEYRLKAKKFKPDFYIKTKNDEIFIIEMKGKVVKKLQRDYGLRKQLFISKYCIPNNWKYIELKSEEWTQDPFTASQQNILNQ